MESNLPTSLCGKGKIAIPVQRKNWYCWPSYLSLSNVTEFFLKESQDSPHHSLKICESNLTHRFKNLSRILKFDTSACLCVACVWGLVEKGGEHDKPKCFSLQQSVRVAEQSSSNSSSLSNSMCLCETF